MAQLKTARLAANDLVSTYPNGQKSLEEDLCTIFGFTPNEDITESPLLLDNAGLVTKDQLRSVAEDEGNGVGLEFWNTTTGQIVSVGVGGTLITPVLGSSGSDLFQVRYQGDPVFGIDLSSGSLIGSVTQNTVQTPLLPATGGAGAESYYNAQGTWSVPSAGVPFSGCILDAVATQTDPVSGISYQAWTENIDVGDHFTEATDDTKIWCVDTGKFFVCSNIFVKMGNGAAMSAIMEIRVNDTDTHGYFYKGGTDNSNYISASCMLDMTAGDYFQIRLTTALVADVLYSGDDPEKTVPFDGRLSFFRIE